MSSSNPIPDHRPPGSDEFEMTVFGPGVGECILLHLGSGDWMVVDSCVSSTGTTPVALDYLRSIGIDPSANVRVVVATHWHDDHIQGLATILRECPQAQFAMSAALPIQQFLQLVLEVDASNRLVKHNSSASEFAEILEVLSTRSSGRWAVGPDTYAQDGCRIFHGGYGASTDVWALSPSSATVTNSLAGLADRLLTPGDCKRFRRFSPNDLSVAILVKAGAFDFLLGADLEDTPAPQFGWKAVLSSTARPAAQARAFKIAHHGSENADHGNVWLSLLTTDPIAVVTPYAKLVKPLPRDTDVRRICSRTHSAYCTTWPPTKKPPRRKGVDGIIRSATKSRRAINPTSGFVRIRVNLNNPLNIPTLELFGGAKKL